MCMPKIKRRKEERGSGSELDWLNFNSMPRLTSYSFIPLMFNTGNINLLDFTL